MQKQRAALFIGSVLVAFIGCEQKVPALEPIKRGEYLVAIGGCDDCHTPKNMGPAAFLNRTWRGDFPGIRPRRRIQFGNPKICKRTTRWP